MNKHKSIPLKQWANGKPLLTHPHVNMFCRQRKLVSSILEPHYNNGIEICYSHRGTFHWVVEGEPLSITANQVSITCPWQKHWPVNHAFNVGDLSWLILTPEQFSKDNNLKLGNWSHLTGVLESQLHDLLLKNSPLKLSLYAQEIGTCMTEMAQELALKKMGYEWRFNRLIDELLLYIIRSVDEDQPLQSPSLFSEVQEIEKILQKDWSKKWNLDSLSEKLYLSPSSLNEKFRHQLGYSPMEFINSIKVKEAKRRLQDSNDSVTTIAMDLGFSTSQYFASVFKKWEGFTPKEVQKKARAAQKES